MAELKKELIKNNFDLKISSQKIELSNENHKLASNYMLPNIAFDANLSSTNVPLNAFGTRLQQSRIEAADFNPEILNHPSAIQNFQAAIHVTQPILNLDAAKYKASSNYAREATRSNHERTEEQLLYLLEDIYIQLQYLYQIKTELNDIKARSEKIYGVVENALNVGYAYSDDLMKAKLRKEQIEDQILETELNIKSLSDKINYLCGREKSDILEPFQSLIPTDENLEIETLNLNRPDFKALSFSVQAAEAQTKALQNGLKPRLNAFISYEYNLYDVLDGGNGYLAGLQLSWQIFNGKKTSIEIQKSKINQMQTGLLVEKMHKESLNEMNHLSNQKTLIKAKIETQSSAIAQAKETLRISLNRYKEGIENTSDLIQNEIQLSQRMIEMHQLRMNYNKNRNAIRFIAG